MKQLHYDGKSNLQIAAQSIEAKDKPAIALYNCINVHISACKLFGGTTVDAVGIYLYKCRNVTIENCLMTNVASGVYASLSTGVYITGNQMLNMNGPMPRGQFVQFDQCYGPANKVTKNKLENVLGQSNPEDAISIYKSNGTPGSLIEVSYNQIRGGGPSLTGGGIALGDGGGSYQIALENTLVNPGQYGIAIAGGSHMVIKNNLVFGKQQPFTNVGISAWDQYDSGSSDVVIIGNRVNFTNSKGEQNASWDGGNVGKISGWNANVWGDAGLGEELIRY